MRNLEQWVCWRYEERGGRTTKVPYSPRTHRRARTDDPDTWASLAAAKRSAPDYDGIGFVFTAEDPFCGVDLDGCVHSDTGEIKAWAREIVDALDSYTELSPSGTGLHIIVNAKLPKGRNRKGNIELYDRLRFFTVTGKRLDGTPSRIEDRQREIDELHRELFPPDALLEPPSRNGRSYELSDDEILHRAMSSANSDRFVRLWEGDRTGYVSDSEADLALCSMLAFWCGPDEERISALFSQSGLVRDKWSRKDYRRRTIHRALCGMTDFYEPHRNGDTPSDRPALPERVHPEVSEFPTDAMPVACQPLILEAEKSLGCAGELVALPMLATLSSAIGTSRIVQIKGGWREWASLFVAVVASPGAMKTPAAKLAKKPAFERQRRHGRHYAEAKEAWKQEIREWEVEQRASRKNGEAAPEEPPPPVMERTVASDTTVEALVSILEDNPRGLLVYKDELSGWVRSMDQYKGGRGSDRQHWLSFWSSDEVVVDRKSRMGEPIIVAKPFVSLFGGIQPAMLSELGAEDGLTDRFLFAYPEPRRIRFTDHEVSIEAEQRYAALYENLSNLTLATDENGDPNPKPLYLTPDARNLFAKQVNTLGAEVMELGFPRSLEGVWAKLRGYLARLSLVLAVCRDPDADFIEAEDVEAATKLLAYFKVHARRVYAELSSPDPLDVLGAHLKEMIEAGGGRLEMTATKLHRELGDAGCETLPERPKELSQAIRRLATRSNALKASFGWRGREKVIRMELREPQENSVGRVGSVGNDDTSTNATCATNARFDRETPKNTVDPSSRYRTRDNSANDKSEQEQPGNHASANDAGSGSVETDSERDEDRVRFTV